MALRQTVRRRLIELVACRPTRRETGHEALRVDAIGTRLHAIDLANWMRQASALEDMGAIFSRALISLKCPKYKLFDFKIYQMNETRVLWSA